jgi:hypothetical protein
MLVTTWYGIPTHQVFSFRVSYAKLQGLTILLIGDPQLKRGHDVEAT